MSYTETHVSKFKIVALGKQNVLDYIKENKLEDEFYIDDENPEYFWIETTDYKNSKYEVDDNGEWLIKYDLHEVSDDSDDYVTCYPTFDGGYVLNARFYNGGVSWWEIIDDEIKKILKQKNEEN